jgi:LemA protein
MNKGGWIVIGVLGAIVLIVLGAIGSAVSAYNGFVNESEAIDGQSKRVDVQYQRAFRLVPKLTELTEQYMQNEREVMENVTALRSGLVAAEGGAYEQKDAYLDEILTFVALVGNRVENYPELQSSVLFRDLMIEITNTENKIAMEKVRYNDNVQTYNAHLRRCCFPVMVANMFGFEPKEYIGYSDRENQSTFPDGEPI